MSRVQDYLWAAKALPAMASMPEEELVKPRTEAMSLSRQEVIMQWGSKNAKIWLALQEWVGSHRLREFILKEDISTVERWWNLKKQLGATRILLRGDFVECLAERELDLAGIMLHVRTERGQMNVWKHILKRIENQERVEAMAKEFCTTADLEKGVKWEIKRFLKRVISQDTGRNGLGGFVCLHEDDSFKKMTGGPFLGTKRVTFLSAPRTNAENAFLNIVNGLVMNPYLDPKETAEIVDLCLPHGTWFTIPFLNSDIDEKDSVEISTVKKIWDRAVQRMRQVQQDEKNWEYVCSGEQITLIHALGVISRSGNSRMLSEYFTEAMDFFPLAVLTFATRWKDEIVGGLDQRVIRAGIMSDQKEVREMAIRLASRIKKARGEAVTGVKHE